MPHSDVLYRFRLRKFALADELGNVRAASKRSAEEGVDAIKAGAWRGRCAGSS